jgi:methylthioribose-1-phosphate isomerase
MKSLNGMIMPENRYVQQGTKMTTYNTIEDTVSVKKWLKA